MFRASEWREIEAKSPAGHAGEPDKAFRMRLGRSSTFPPGPGHVDRNGRMPLLGPDQKFDPQCGLDGAMGEILPTLCTLVSPKLNEKALLHRRPRQSADFIALRSLGHFLCLDEGAVWIRWLIR